MTTGLVKKAVDVVQGVPQQVADRVERVFGEIGVAVVCKVKDSIVRIDISLLEDLSEERVLALIEQAATDVAARIRFVDPSVAAGGLVEDAADALRSGVEKARDAIHEATEHER